MNKLLFEARCKRCGCLVEVDFNKRFGDGDTKEFADGIIVQFGDGFVNDCLICKTQTFQEPVTLIKNAE